MTEHQSVIIRSPVWGDLPQFLQLGRALHQESWYSHLSFDENRVAGFFYEHVIDRDKTFCRVASFQERLVGAVAGLRVTNWFSRDAGVFDSFLYVIPSHRGSITAYRLWCQMRDWARQIGAKEMTHGVGTAIAIDRADKFFCRLGMTKVGSIYKLKIDDPLSASPTDNTCDLTNVSTATPQSRILNATLAPLGLDASAS
jgi:hypothetical protein